MSIFNIFQIGKKSATQATPIPVPDANSCEDDSNQAIEESNQQAKSTRNIPEGVKRVYNLIILDESGSMRSIYQPALNGVNETLQTIREAQREHDDQKHFVSLIAFDSGHYNLIYCNTPADNATDITQEQYRPNGGTPLYDAMGRSINELRSNVVKGDFVLVTVITDGYENASREYNGRAIKSLVEAMKEEGWVFTYIGANQDVKAVAESMSIDNSLAFETSDAGTDAMFEHERRSRKNFFEKLSSNMPMIDLSMGYFDDEEENDVKDNKF